LIDTDKIAKSLPSRSGKRLLLINIVSCELIVSCRTGRYFGSEWLEIFEFNPAKDCRLSERLCAHVIKPRFCTSKICLPSSSSCILQECRGYPRTWDNNKLRHLLISNANFGLKDKLAERGADFEDKSDSWLLSSRLKTLPRNISMFRTEKTYGTVLNLVGVTVCCYPCDQLTFCKTLIFGYPGGNLVGSRRSGSKLQSRFGAV
jgi:hypothetical protein